jgi:hypothetical protein
MEGVVWSFCWFGLGLGMLFGLVLVCHCYYRIFFENEQIYLKGYDSKDNNFF